MLKSGSLPSRFDAVAIFAVELLSDSLGLPILNAEVGVNRIFGIGDYSSISYVESGNFPRFTRIPFSELNAAMAVVVGSVPMRR